MGIESLDEYAKRMAKLAENGELVYNSEIDEIKEEMVNAVCHFCKKQLKWYQSKQKNTYLANEDLSPHRNFYCCVNTWEEYNNVHEPNKKDPKDMSLLLERGGEENAVK